MARTSQLPATRKNDDKAAEPTFEQALARLEEIAHQLESGDLPLEQAIALAEEGAKLSQLCEEQLTSAEGKILQFVERMGRPELEPFEPEEAEEE